MWRQFTLTTCAVIAVTGCSKQAPAPKAVQPAQEATKESTKEARPTKAEAPPTKNDNPAKTPENRPASAAVATAVVGQPAPDFTLPGVDGKDVKLSSLRGNVVVLEWYNPDCPFVKWAHDKGPLKQMAATYATKDVRWLAINSGAPGKQGHGLQRNKASLAEYNLAHPILLDESGKVGKAYGATNTPQLYVIDKAGTLVYAGGLDNLPFGEMAEKGDARKHCEEALTDVLAGKPVRVPKTKPWGCTVKYAS